MAKIKIQKKDIWIDMTPMSDVMTLRVRAEDSRAGCLEHSGNPRGQGILRYGKQEQHAGNAGRYDR